MKERIILMTLLIAMLLPASLVKAEIYPRTTSFCPQDVDFNIHVTTFWDDRDTPEDMSDDIIVGVHTVITDKPRPDGGNIIESKDASKIHSRASEYITDKISEHLKIGGSINLVRELFDLDEQILRFQNELDNIDN